MTWCPSFTNKCRYPSWQTLPVQSSCISRKYLIRMKMLLQNKFLKFIRKYFCTILITTYFFTLIRIFRMTWHSLNLGIQPHEALKFPSIPGTPEKAFVCFAQIEPTGVLIDLCWLNHWLCQCVDF